MEKRSSTATALARPGRSGEPAGSGTNARTGVPPTGLPPTGLPKTGLPKTGLPKIGLPNTGTPGRRSPEGRSGAALRSRSEPPAPRAGSVLSRALLGLLAGGLLLAGTASSYAGAPTSSTPTRADWTEQEVGTVPNEFGDLVAVGGVPSRYVYVFRNTDGDIRLVDHAGTKLPKQAMRIRRTEPETPPRPDPKAEWQEHEMGVLPERFGEVVGLLGIQGSRVLVLVDGEGSVHAIPIRGAKLGDRAYVLRRDEATPDRNDRSAVERRDAKDRRPSSRSAADPWKLTDLGSVPARFGSLVAVAGTLTRLTTVFRDDDGQLHFIEIAGNEVRRVATRVRRTEPEGKPTPDRVPAWQVTEAGVIPDAYGPLRAVIGVKGNYALLFEEPEGTIRLIDFSGIQVKRTARLIERPDATFTGRRKVDGWDETSLGAIPEAFGSLRWWAGAPARQGLVLQNEDGVIRVIDVTGTRLPDRLTRIQREY